MVRNNSDRQPCVRHFWGRIQSSYRSSSLLLLSYRDFQLDTILTHRCQPNNNDDTIIVNVMPDRLGHCVLISFFFRVFFFFPLSNSQQLSTRNSWKFGPSFNQRGKIGATGKLSALFTAASMSHANESVFKLFRRKNHTFHTIILSNERTTYFFGIFSPYLDHPATSENIF